MKTIWTKLIVSILFFIVTPIALAQDCAQIVSISSNVTAVASGEPYKCMVEVDSTSVNSKTIACGVSFNGGWPFDFCPSNEFFGGWNGSTASFNCVFPNTNLPTDIQTVELVGYDFKDSCGPSTGKRLPLVFGNENEDDTETSQDPSAPEAQVQEVRPLLARLITELLSGVTSQLPPSITDETPFSEPTEIPDNIAPEGTPPANGNPQVSDAAIRQLLQTDSAAYSSSILSSVSGCIANKQIYQTASQYSGVPWQVLAGIHKRENDTCSTGQSLVSGRAIGAVEPDLQGDCTSGESGPGVPYPDGAGGCKFRTFLDTVIYAGRHLAGKIGKVPGTHNELIRALFYYNGTGNATCRFSSYLPSIPGYCPPQTEGIDSAYVMSKYSSQFDPMYVIYCRDGIICPFVDARIGSLTAARAVAIQ